MGIAKNVPRSFKLFIGYFLLFIINGCFYTWSMLSLAFMNAFPNWTADQMALNATINIAASAIGSLLVPWFLRKFSTKSIARLSGIMFGVGWFFVLLIQWCPNIALLYVGYTLTGYANGQLYSIIGQVLNACYPERTGAVSGGLLFVTGIGSLFMGFAEQTIINSIGLFKLCLVFSIGFFALIFFCSQWLVQPHGWGNIAANHNIKSEDASPEVSLQQAVRMPKFWLFFAWSISLASGGLLAINNAANIFTYYQAPAVAGMLVMLCTGIGCQLMGFAIDRFGLRVSMLCAALFSLVVGVLLLIGHWSEWTMAILVGVLLCGIGYGSTTSAKMAGAVKLFGGKNLASFFGVFNLNVIPAAFMGPYISGVLQMLGKGYLPSFLLIAVLSVLALLATVLGWKNFIEVPKYNSEENTTV